MNVDLHPPLRELHLFAGAGGGILGGILLGHMPVCAVELEEYPRRVLLQRQRDGLLPWFPVWDDVRTFDGTPWRGRVDVIAGGFPCQDISAAGKGAGISGERSGLWSEFARIIGEVRPSYVLIENSPLLVSRGLDRVLGDLVALGFDAEWGVLGACDAGASHKRDRIWILAHAMQTGQPNAGRIPTTQASPKVRATPGLGHREISPPREAKRWPPEPEVDRVAHGVACGMDRLAALGNGQVPAVAALAWETLMARIEKRREAA